MWRPITKIGLVIIGALLILYDLLPFVDQARHDTISEVIAEYSLKLFSLPLVFGILCGHFFFLRDNTRPIPAVTLPLGLIVIAIDVLSYKFDLSALHMLQSYPAIWFVLGIPLGAMFWPQTRTDKLT